MGLPDEHIRSKILAKIRIYILSGAELVCTLWNEIPCTMQQSRFWLILEFFTGKFQGRVVKIELY